MHPTNLRSNRSLFLPQDSGSPRQGLFQHLSDLGPLARLDFERFQVAGETLFKIEGDVLPIGQEDEEARIASLAHALKKLGNIEDAAEFIRCLNSLCDGGDARSRQVAASYYYREIAERGTPIVLKEMALLAMQLQQSAIEECEAEVSHLTLETDNECGSDSTEPLRKGIFEQELAAISRMTSGYRRASGFALDEFETFLDQMLLDGLEGEDLAAHVESFENLMQYDEAGAILLMSAHERSIACGRLDAEWSIEDLPLEAQHLAAQLRRDYSTGISIEDMWEDLNAQIEVLYPIARKTENGRRFYSYANRELQALCREILESILIDCQTDFHLSGLRTQRAYREFYNALRKARDGKTVGSVMKQAFQAREAGRLPLKYFTALVTASKLQRERLDRALTSPNAIAILQEIQQASGAKLGYLSWAMYGQNQPEHPIHQLNSNEQQMVWNKLKARRTETVAAAA